MEPAPRSEVVRRAIAIAFWLALLFGFARFANWLALAVLSRETIAKTSLQTFQMVCQIAVLALGIGASAALLRQRREGLGFARVPGWAPSLSTVLAAPLVFVCSWFIALQIALPTLLEELKTRGANASQQNAGDFGRMLTQAPLLTVLLMGAVLGALGEELFFRGLLWSTITDLTRRFAPPDAAREPQEQAGEAGEAGAPASAPPASIAPPPALGQRALAIALRGGIATIVCAALFGWMHKDLPGGVGIVRLVSTTCLGLALGVVRQATGGVLACIALHALYNAIVIANLHKKFASSDKPVLEGIPNTLVLCAVLGVVAIGAIAFVRALIARRSRSVLFTE